MKNYLKRTNTKHSFGLVIKVTALGVGALAWAAVFGQQASTPSGDDKTAGRDRVDEVKAMSDGSHYKFGSGSLNKTAEGP